MSYRAIVRRVARKASPIALNGPHEPNSTRKRTASAHHNRSSIATIQGPWADTLKQAAHHFTISTRGKGLYEFTSSINEWVAAQNLQTGLLTIFCRHTSASLLIQENADPTVQRDIRTYFDHIAPDVPPAGRSYQHNDEGLDDMPAHLKTALTQVQLSIPVLNGRLVLGTWQGVYLFEHRVRPHRREIVLHLLGE
jgi:secondary thiamine-phosphate synthase enzyme